MINLKMEINFILKECQKMSDRIQSVMDPLPAGDVYFQKKNKQGYYLDASKTKNGKHVFLGKANDPAVEIRLKYQVCRIIYNRIQKLIQALQEIINTIPLTIDLNDLEKELPEKYTEFPRSLFKDLGMIDQKALTIQTENNYQGYSKWLRHQTINGFMVRSKSEQIIADRLYVNGIHFEYEPALPNDNGPETHPDFRLFYPAENRWIFLEHVGRPSDPQYKENFLKKIRNYTDQGLLIGYDLFFTYDRPDGSLDLHTLDMLISMISQKH